MHFSLKRAFFKQLAVKISQVGVFSLLSSCAILHHAQVSDIDDDKKFKRIAFDVKVNESGFSLDEALRLSKGFTSSKQARDDLEQVRLILALSNMGPQTGNPTFNDTYADQILSAILKECPSGNVTEVKSIREMRKYPVISGEIVKITGYCLVPN